MARSPSKRALRRHLRVTACGDQTVANGSTKYIIPQDSRLMTQMHGQALRSKKISTRLWCFLHQCIRPPIGLLAILDISARASSSHGETVGQSLISRAEQCNRLAFAS